MKIFTVSSILFLSLSLSSLTAFASEKHVCVRYAGNNPTMPLRLNGCVEIETPICAGWKAVRGELADRQENAIFGNVSRAMIKDIFAYVDADSCDDERIPDSIENSKH